eukprot:CAMPEP_0204637576 /NCGR_PEP_ID=MMETSP0717-20131115/37027_1 /ASSEMBLY_ACC=CAM_ASM_000666 /TAXON_ID=230516 /ORGANISM="Chaetoceros curvisetus" /LENGTH=68 /DNA_ID=CAMNT_0051657039 /DNA_START=20 /DNA_END=222 /DNA_ORIENTATION=+
MAKLGLTIDFAEQELNRIKMGYTAGLGEKKDIDASEIYITKKELMDELLLMYKSLCDTGNQLTADGRV